MLEPTLARPVLGRAVLLLTAALLGAGCRALEGPTPLPWRTVNATVLRQGSTEIGTIAWQVENRDPFPNEILPGRVVLTLSPHVDSVLLTRDVLTSSTGGGRRHAVTFVVVGGDSARRTVVLGTTPGRSGSIDSSTQFESYAFQLVAAWGGGALIAPAAARAWTGPIPFPTDQVTRIRCYGAPVGTLIVAPDTSFLYFGGCAFAFASVPAAGASSRYVFGAIEMFSFDLDVLQLSGLAADTLRAQVVLRSNSGPNLLSTDTVAFQLNRRSP